MLTRQVRFSQLEGATLPSPRELLNAAKAEIREIDPHEVAERLHHYYLLDVRGPDEFEQGAVPGAIHVPRGNLEFSVEGRLPDKSVPVAVYCAGGVRSAFAAKTLQELGYTGVGTIGIIDMDVVDASNLQRQILHNLDRVGMRKVDSARMTLEAINPDLKVKTYDTRLGADNVLDIIDGYDVIVDGTDNFPTRYLVNDAALLKRIPVVHGSIFRFEGQITVLNPYVGPCYRCMIPEPPPAELAPSCAEAGVLGVLPGIVGSIQAVEAIKLLLELGDPLVGRLLTYDALDQSFRTFKVRRDPECPACGEHASPIQIAEYDDLCMPHAVLA